MTDETVKVCVRIPKSRTAEPLAFAKKLREQGEDKARPPGWDAKEIHRIASGNYGGLLQMFEAHGWPERGSDMMRQVQGRVKKEYDSVEAFVAKHAED